MQSTVKDYKIELANKKYIDRTDKNTKLDNIKGYWKEINNIAIIEPFQGEDPLSREDVTNKTYDGSITPKTHIHETAAYLDKDKSTFVTEYAFANEDGNLQSHVVRLGINVNNISYANDIEEYNQSIKNEFVTLFKIYADKDKLQSILQSKLTLKEYKNDQSNLYTELSSHKKELEKQLKSLKNREDQKYKNLSTQKSETVQKIRELDVLKKITEMLDYNYVDSMSLINALDSTIPNNISSSKSILSEKSIGTAVGIKNVSKYITHLKIEETLINKATSLFAQDSNLKSILVDIHARNTKSSLIENDQETHTVVLYRPNSHKKEIFVIDPNNSEFSYHLSNKKWLNTDSLNGFTLFADCTKQIYKSASDETGVDIDQGRNCIDISVKLAFALGFELGEFKTVAEVFSSNAIQTITNQQETYASLPNKLEDVPMLNKQKSDIKHSNKVTMLITKIAVHYKDFKQTIYKKYKDMFDAKGTLDQIESEYDNFFDELSKRKFLTKKFFDEQYKTLKEHLTEKYVDEQIDLKISGDLPSEAEEL